MIKFIKKVKEHFTILIKCMHLFWNSSKKFFLATIVSNMLTGTIMPIHLILWNNFLNSVVEAT